MVYLAQRDLDRFVQGIRGLDGHYRQDAFPRIAMRTIQTVVPGISAAYNEIHPLSGEAVGTVDPPDSAPSPELAAIFDAHLVQHPLIDQSERFIPSSAQLISDFLPEREFHRLPLYGDFYRRLDTEDQLVVRLPSPALTIIGLVVNRDRRSFTEADRLLVSLVRSHLLQAYRHAEAVTLLEEALTSGGQEAVWLTPDGRIRRATPRAPRLFERYFGRRPHTAATQLPPEVSDWLREERHRRDEGSAFREPQPLIVIAAAGRLTIRWFARSSGEVDLLSLSERRADPAVTAAYDLGLTPREMEVLSWVIRGQTSAEIALLLGMSRRTVETHLGHMYRKLGVTTRAALVALALQTPDTLT